MPAVPKRPGDIVALPATATRIVVGGSGKYLLAALPQIKQVAVVDVAARKIVKLVPFEDTHMYLVAGMLHAIRDPWSRNKGLLSRYKLPSGELELTAPCPGYTLIAMGSSSEGPLLCHGPKLGQLIRSGNATTELGCRNGLPTDATNR